MVEHWFSSHDGLKLYSRLYAPAAAQAPVVLCLHGLTRNSRDFEDLAPHLAAQYRVIVPDMRGRGFSARDANASNYTIAIYVQDMHRLLAELAAPRVAIIGTSMGGLMAMVMAATQPGQVVGIVLNDIGPEVNPAGLERIRGYAGKVAAVRTWPEAVAQARSIYGSAWPNLSDARWEAIARRGYRVNAEGAPEVDADPRIAEPLRNTATAAPDLWPLWKTLAGVPMLAIRGADSDILSAATLARMQHEKPDLESLTVPERGHVPLLDEPECIAAIDRFLSRLTRPVGTT